MLDTTCSSKSSAALYFAYFGAATAVLATPSSCIRTRGAIAERAEPVGAVLLAEITNISRFIAPINRAGIHVPGVRLTKPSRYGMVAWSGEGRLASAARVDTQASCAVLVAQASGFCSSGAAFNRAQRPNVFSA